MKNIALTLLIMFAGNAFAQDYDYYNKNLTPEQKKQAIYLEKNIMATCCFGGPVYSHGKNQITEKAKITIRRLISDGKTTDEILDHFRNSIDPRTNQPFGNRILASPKASETVGQVSYWMVIVFALIGFGLLVIAIRKLLAQKDEQAEPVDLSDDTLKKIESELSDLP